MNDLEQLQRDAAAEPENLCLQAALHRAEMQAGRRPRRVLQRPLFKALRPTWRGRGAEQETHLWVENIFNDVYLTECELFICGALDLLVLPDVDLTCPWCFMTLSRIRQPARPLHVIVANVSEVSTTRWYEDGHNVTITGTQSVPVPGSRNLRGYAPADVDLTMRALGELPPARDQAIIATYPIDPPNHEE